MVDLMDELIGRRGDEGGRTPVFSVRAQSHERFVSPGKSLNEVSIWSKIVGGLLAVAQARAERHETRKSLGELIG